MDDVRARTLLETERARVETLLGETTVAAQEERSSANEQGGDIADPAAELTDEQQDDAVAVQLRDRLAAIARAERRLDDGTYGRSVR
ncbi:MAG TPA: hypothetical protein VMD28_06680, partial [Acidimicrobiales bacterium]|nr:hypothetical protein [Acidimicrobiales bacterium]